MNCRVLEERTLSNLTPTNAVSAVWGRDEVYGQPRHADRLIVPDACFAAEERAGSHKP